MTQRNVTQRNVTQRNIISKMTSKAADNLQSTSSPEGVTGRTVESSQATMDRNFLLTPGLTPGARPPIHPIAQTPMPRIPMPFTPSSGYTSPFRSQCGCPSWGATKQKGGWSNQPTLFADVYLGHHRSI